MTRSLPHALPMLGGVLLLAGAGAVIVACTRSQAAEQANESRPVTAQQPLDETAATRLLYERPVDEWPTAVVDEGVAFVEFGPVPDPVFPEDNPHSDVKEELGKLLFFDPRLSGSGQMACASCHDPDLAWADGRTASFGDRRMVLKRNAPTIKNSGHFTTLFWDGRAGSLEELVLAVIQNPNELHAELPDVEKKLAASGAYVAMFESAFGDPEITAERIAQAVATFCRSVNSSKSDLDRFMEGDYDRLSDAAVRGLHLFRNEARCANCHHGPLFTDNEHHNIGLSVYGQKRFEDLGRFNQTGVVEDVGAFRTQSLRNITNTAPYMHHGRFTLENVLNLYNAGMPEIKRGERFKDDPNFPIKDPLIQPLDLTDREMADLAAFLDSLADRRRRVDPPQLPAMD